MSSITWKDLYGDIHFEWTGSSCQIRYPSPNNSGQEILNIEEALIAHQMAHDAIRPSHLVRTRALVASLTPGQNICIPGLQLTVCTTSTGYVVAHEGVVSGPIALLQDPDDVTILVGTLTARSDEVRLLLAARCTLDAYLSGYLKADPEKLKIDWTAFLDDENETYRTFVRRHHVGVGLKSRRRGFEVAVAAMAANVRHWLVGEIIVLPEPTVIPTRLNLN